MLNTGIFPEYLRQGRLVPFSKLKTNDRVCLDDIRPIVVKSHITKICEKRFFSRLEVLKVKFLKQVVTRLASSSLTQH